MSSGTDLFVLCAKAEDPPRQHARAEHQRRSVPIEVVVQGPVSRREATVERNQLCDSVGIERSELIAP